MSADDLIHINGDRLWGTLMQLAKIGEYVDERTGLLGVNRQTLTDEEADGRRLVMSWFEEAGLTVRVDEMGNVYGRRDGTDNSLAPVLIGSHIDSVATAGAFDGCLGVLGGLEVIRRMNELKIVTKRPIEIAFFTEEEGVRFGTDMLGSAVAAGRLSLEYAHGLQDHNGVTLGSELIRHGFNGPTPVKLDPPYAYVECHIEQGPVLAAAGLEVGVVTGVQAISWQEVTIHGRAAHAGTTPTELRVDAGLAASMTIVELRAMCDSGDYGQLRSTVGNIEVSPGLTNIVPQKAVFTVDLRNPSNEDMTRAEEALDAYLKSLEEKWLGLVTSTKRLAKTAHVPFADFVKDAIAEVAADFGYSNMQLLSGAGHDAQEIAAIAPSAMIFVPGEYDGISHNPREYSTPEACAQGINVLASVVRRLADNE